MFHHTLRITVIISVIFFPFDVKAICFKEFTHENSPSPINIESCKVIESKTATPLTLFNAFLDFVNLTNTGKTLDAYSNQLLDPTFITGGVLCNKIYKIHTIRFYINPDASGRSGNAWDGQGFPIEMTVIYYNIIYGSMKNALKFPGAITILSFPIKVSKFVNLGFIPLQLALSFDLLEKPHSSILIPGLFVYIWFDNISPLSNYYAYTGSYYDPETGKQVQNANYMVTDPKQAFSISETQFKAFKHVAGLDGKPLNSTPPIYPQGLRKVYKIHGISQVLLPVF